MLRLLKRALVIVGLVLAAIVVSFVIVVSLGIRVDLDRFREPFVAIASKSLGREVRLEGDVYLVPTWSVTLEANGLTIANPPGFEEPEFAHLELARIQVAALPLLWRRVVIRELRAEGIAATFERRADGAVNWAFEGEAAPEEEPDTAEVPEEAAEAEPAWQALLPSSVVLEDLSFFDVRAEVRDRADGLERTLVLEEFTGSAATDAPIEFDLKGRYDQQEFAGAIRGGDPSALIGGAEPWPLRFEIGIADSRLVLTGKVEAGSFGVGDTLALFLETAASPLAGFEERRLGEVTLVLEGERLEALGPVLEVALPPWGPYYLELRFEASSGGNVRAEVVSRVGSSELTGTLTLTAGSRPPHLDLALRAPQIQLDDYRLEGWNPVAAEEAAQAAAADDPAQPASERALLSPEVMKSLDAKLEIDVDRVAAGNEWLGKGRLAARLEGGVFHLDAFDVEVPGGAITTRASLAPRGRSVHGSLKLDITRFEYGILARRLNPESDLAGLFGLEIELESTAPRATDFLEHASGRFDFAVFPEKLEAGVVDLWAVNLVAAVLPAVDDDEQSKVNCLIALMDMQDGVMREHALMIDTTRLTVNGEATVDFRKRRVEAELAPEAKRPEFFSAATPVQVAGDFEDFDIDVPPGELLATVVSFMTSVVHVPVRRLFSGDEDTGELDTCMAALDRR